MDDIRTYNTRKKRIPTSTEAMRAVFINKICKRNETKPKVEKKSKKAQKLIKELPPVDKNHELMNDSFSPRVNRANDRFYDICQKDVRSKSKQKKDNTPDDKCAGFTFKNIACNSKELDAIVFASPISTSNYSTSELLNNNKTVELIRNDDCESPKTRTQNKKTYGHKVRPFVVPEVEIFIRPRNDSGNMNKTIVCASPVLTNKYLKTTEVITSSALNSIEDDEVIARSVREVYDWSFKSPAFDSTINISCDQKANDMSQETDAIETKQKNQIGKSTRNCNLPINGNCVDGEKLDNIKKIKFDVTKKEYLDASRDLFSDDDLIEDRNFEQIDCKENIVVDKGSPALSSVIKLEEPLISNCFVNAQFDSPKSFVSLRNVQAMDSPQSIPTNEVIYDYEFEETRYDSDDVDVFNEAICEDETDLTLDPLQMEKTISDRMAVKIHSSIVNREEVNPLGVELIVQIQRIPYENILQLIEIQDEKYEDLLACTGRRYQNTNASRKHSVYHQRSISTNLDTFESFMAQPDISKKLSIEDEHSSKNTKVKNSSSKQEVLKSSKSNACKVLPPPIFETTDNASIPHKSTTDLFNQTLLNKKRDEKNEINERILENLTQLIAFADPPPLVLIDTHNVPKPQETTIDVDMCEEQPGKLVTFTDPPPLVFIDTHNVPNVHETTIDVDMCEEPSFKRTRSLKKRDEQTENNKRIVEKPTKSTAYKVPPPPISETIDNVSIPQEITIDVDMCEEPSFKQTRSLKNRDEKYENNKRIEEKPTKSNTSKIHPTPIFETVEIVPKPEETISSGDLCEEPSLRQTRSLTNHDKENEKETITKESGVKESNRPNIQIYNAPNRNPKCNDTVVPLPGSSQNDSVLDESLKAVRTSCKPGKQWRRTLLQQKHEKVSLQKSAEDFMDQLDLPLQEKEIFIDIEDSLTAHKLDKTAKVSTMSGTSQNSSLLNETVTLFNLKPGKHWRRSLVNRRNTNSQRSNPNTSVLEHTINSVASPAFLNTSRLATKNISIDCREYRLSQNKVDVLDHTICLQNQKTGERFKEISLHEGLEKKNSLPFDGNFNDKEITERHKNWVLNLCNQEAPIKFSSVFQYSRKKWTKIGEGVYGEVFMKTYRTRSVVIKIIPIEGDLMVNGEKQKTYKDVITEIITAQQLHDLRSCVKNEATTFNELVKVNCIYGEYPSHLVKHWDLYHEVKGSENDSPVVFDGKQHYIALQMGYGGVDLESFKFASFEQIQSVFIQIALALAAAEAQLQFEHRDLHWGNVLVQKCPQKTISYKLEGKRYDLEDCSLQATIIDFTLSRITHDGMVLFNDLSKDPDLFEAEGDYQFDIYRMMRDHNGNDWKKFSPYTNVLWLHYLLTKMTTDMIFSSEPHQSDMEYLNWLQSAKYKILKFTSASMFAKTYFKHLVP